MADTWGYLPLHIQDYGRPGAALNLKEKPLIPDPASTNPASILQGVGRLRRRRAISGWAYPGEYEVLEVDYEAYTKRAVTFGDGFSMEAYIESLEGERRLGTSLLFYSLTFVEG